MDFLCNECAKTFAKEVDLVIHQARAHDKRSFSCKMCHVINVGYTIHNNHMRVHKPKKKTTRLLKCEKSYYETNKKQNLNRHILTVHNEKKDLNKSKNRSCRNLRNLRNLGKLNRAVNWKKLNKPFVESVIQDIGKVFQLLQAEFDLSMPLKIHVILSHYIEFFDAKQETLLSYNDEFTESMHSQLRLFEEAHKYLNNKKGSKSHREMQQKSVVHINSLNLGDI